MHSNQMDQTKQAVQAELLDIFMDLKTHEERSREREARKRRLEARRAIEQYNERKALDDALKDGWDDL